MRRGNGCLIDAGRFKNSPWVLHLSPIHSHAERCGLTLAPAASLRLSARHRDRYLSPSTFLTTLRRREWIASDSSVIQLLRLTRIPRREEETLRRFAILLCSLCIFAAAARAQTDSDAAIKSKIVALEQLWNQAYKSGDTKALESILDDAIVLVNDDGSVQTKSEFLSSVKTSTPQPTAQQQQVAPESSASTFTAMSRLPPA